jgi:hypothetical protein
MKLMKEALRARANYQSTDSDCHTEAVNGRKKGAYALQQGKEEA